ncbi:MAG: TonB-dependent receptor plug domain-containing protein [Parasphingorhabdus sp.]|nr:TonB-dependent receptor plug domain-containing protein [Parasphingorhabdus sp.]
MTKFSKLMSGAAPMVLGLAMVSAPAYAQDEEAAATTAEDVIVVTGSRITNPNLELSSPVGVVTSQELELRQTNTAEQFLRELPSAVPSIGSAVNNGNGGASFVNLRGIGSVRNLVLLDGRRFVPADTTGRVDLNNIPLAVIERTDILTGGATTTYGADAIGGVVNFITKRNFSGLEASFSEQITEQGDGNVLRGDVTIGANFDDGRGNVVLSVGYQEQDAVFQGGRSFSEFNVGSFTGTASGSSNAVPAVIAGYGGPTRQISDDGQSVTPFNRPFNFNPFNIFQTPFERFNIYGSGRYEVSDAVEVYTQAVFSKQTVSTIIAPGGSFFNTYQIPLSNPFIPTAVLNLYCTALALDAAGCSAAAAATGPSDPNYVEIGSQVRRRSVEAGTRDSNFTTQLFNIVAGVRGNITDNISWDVSGTYGESDQVQRQTGFARFTRLQQSLRASDPGACDDTTNGCVPINLFGPAGSITPEMVAFVFSQEQTVSNLASIATANAQINGDLGFGFAETPIAFAVGGEYRKFTAQQRSDDASKTPGEVVGGGGAAPDIDGQYDVYDAFGEFGDPAVGG